MTAGIQVFNAYKTLQLTNNQLPYVLLRSVRIDKNTKWSTIDQVCRIQSDIFDFGGDIQNYDDVIFFMRASGFDARCTVDIFGNVFKWHDLTLKDGDYIDIYVFTKYKPSFSGKSGLQLFNREMGLVFDSSWPILNIVGFYTIPAFKPDYNSNGTVSSYSIETEFNHSQYAVALSTCKQIHYKLTGNIMAAQLQNCIWMVDNVIKVNWVPIDSDTSGGWTGESGFAQTNQTYAYVIDTTNLPLPYAGI